MRQFQKAFLFFVSAVWLSTAHSADNSSIHSPDKVEPQNCSSLDTKEKEYKLGNGELVNFLEWTPPSDTPIRRDKPGGYAGLIKMDDGEKVRVLFPWKWKDENAPLLELKLAPLPVEMKKGNHYTFCYWTVKRAGSSPYVTISIDHPESLRKQGD